jgi:hypothetical protein
MTMRYAHLSPGHLRSAVAVLDNVKIDVPLPAPKAAKKTRASPLWTAALPVRIIGTPPASALLRSRAPSRFVTAATFSARRREVGGAGAMPRALVMAGSGDYVARSCLVTEATDHLMASFSASRNTFVSRK